MVSPFSPQLPVCCTRVCYGYPVYRWRCDGIRPYALHPVPRCRCRVRLSRCPGCLTTPLNIAPPALPLVSARSTCTAEIASANTPPTVSRPHSVSRIVFFAPRPFLWVLKSKCPLPGASALLLLSSLPRITKGPVPAVLTLTSAVTATYYGQAIYKLRQ